MTALFPGTGWLADAICVVEPIDPERPRPVLDVEAFLVANAVQRRRAHFAAGRHCAREALRQLGHPVTCLLRRETGAPAWPDGCVGSITHCDGMATAIVAESSRWRAVGIDVEPDRRLLEDVASYALTSVEREVLAKQCGNFELIAFSAKECVHKCLHPLRNAFLEFDEVEIVFDTAGHFMPCPVSQAARAAFEDLRFQGRWLRADGFIWSLLAVA